MTRNKNIIARSYSYPNTARLVKGGSGYFDLMVKLIDQATDTVHLQTYIFREDITGGRIADALMKAAARDVKVYLMTDGYASQSLSVKMRQQLASAGVHFRFFESLFRSKYFYFGRRLHHKILVVDARCAVVGGINIADHYNDLDGKPAWLDFALFAEGAIARELCVLCWKTWKSFPLKMGITPCETKQLEFDIPLTSSTNLRMRRNDWVRRKNQISASYIEMFRLAKSDITILCSYFLPGETIRRLLGQAAQRGVKIRVVTAGPSDVMLSKHAERWLYDWLLRHKIELYEYQPTVLHAKIAVCDGKWFTVGSYNINKLSAYASIELNIDVQNAELAKSVKEIIDLLIQKDCLAITPEMHSKHKNIFRQITRWSSFQLLRLIFFMLTFYYKHKK